MRELPLHRLDGAEVADHTLSVTVDLSNRPHPVTVTAAGTSERWPVLEGRTNPGTPWRWPWFEARFRPGPLDDEGQNALFDALGGVLTPGAYVMLSCDGFTEDNWALTIGIPPPATRLGELLWRAGARWYKVWYYPEGWREGHEKLQGNTPPNDGHRARAEAAIRDELTAFLEGALAGEHPGCRARAARLLAQLDPKPGSRNR